MRVRFKGGSISYRALSEKVEYDEVLGKFCLCYEIAGMGWCAKEMFEPATGQEVEFKEVMLEIWKNKS